VTDTNKELRIEHVEITVLNLFHCQRIHVVDQWSIENLMPSQTKITAIVTEKNVPASSLPFTRLVECLIQKSVVAECGIPDLGTSFR